MNDVSQFEEVNNPHSVEFPAELVFNT